MELGNESVSRRGEHIFARKREIVLGGVFRKVGVCVFAFLGGVFRVWGGAFVSWGVFSRQANTKCRCKIVMRTDVQAK